MQKNAEPIREFVILVNQDHNMDDLKRLTTAIEKKFKIQAFSWAIHRDEGTMYEKGEELLNEHKDHQIVNFDDGSFAALNLHAHVLFDIQDKTTGRMTNFKKSDFSLIQDLAANVLGMDRGKRGSEAKHIHDYKKYAEEKRDLEEKKAELEKEEAELLKKTSFAWKAKNFCGLWLLRRWTNRSISKFVRDSDAKIIGLGGEQSRLGGEQSRLKDKIKQCEDEFNKSKDGSGERKDEIEGIEAEIKKYKKRRAALSRTIQENLEGR